MRKLLLAFVGIAASFAVYAQQVDLSKHFKNMKPRNIGPAGMSGRVTAIDAVWTNPNIIFLGTASGGVWKTENGGASWTPIFDDQPIQNIGAIALVQSNPSVVWAGTGEGNPRNSISLGEGIYKSLDGGKTWKRMGLEKTRNIHRIIKVFRLYYRKNRTEYLFLRDTSIRFYIGEYCWLDIKTIFIMYF